jgi:hypothetical protein
MEVRRVAKTEGLVWIGIGIVVSLLSWRTEVGSFHEPGPGFIGLMAGLFLIGIGFAMVALTLVSSISSSYGLGSRATFRIPSWPRLAYTVGLLVSYGLLLDKLGYIVTTFLVMWGLFYNREKGRWYTSCLASLLSVAITYLLFEVWLHCQFPRGIFPWR